MSEETKTGKLRGLTRKVSGFLRILRRTYHERRGAQPLDASQIDRTMLSVLYRKAAADLGLEVYEIGQALCISGRGKTFHTWGFSTDLDTSPLYMITEDKLLIRNLFKEQGFSIPEGRAFDWRDQSEAVEYALSLGRPCVVKPASFTSGSKGVTTRLATRSDIARAFRFAGLFAHQVLIEEFIPGHNYRFLIYKGKCISVLQRDLPAVVGDGASTVLELAEEENRNRIKRSNWQEGDPPWIPLPTDAAALLHLKRQGFDWKYAPKAGEQVEVWGASSFAFGTTFTEVLDRVHPDQIRAAVQAAGAIRMTIAGVDIISSDIEGPRHHILEINVSPGLKIHYVIRNPEEMKDPIRTILKDYFEIAAADSNG